jgi:uncharacterized DUF497 family protein
LDSRRLGNEFGKAVELPEPLDSRTVEPKFYLVDDRTDYQETRYRMWGLIDDAWHCLVFTWRNGVMRAISLRRAHAKEIRRYGQVASRGKAPGQDHAPRKEAEDGDV